MVPLESSLICDSTMCLFPEPLETFFVASSMGTQ